MAWPDGGAATPGPYRAAMIAGAGHEHPARLSLGYAVPPPAEAGNIAREDYQQSLVQGNRNLTAYTGCHPVATNIVEHLGDGPASSFGRYRGAVTPLQQAGDPSATPAHTALHQTLTDIQARRLPAQVMRYTHQHHSVAIFAHEGGLEPIEAWAGGADNEEHRRQLEAQGTATVATNPLHDSLIQPRPIIPLDQAIGLANNLGSRDRNVRSTALDRLSGAGIGGFEAGNRPIAQRAISLERRAAAAPDEVQRRVGDRLAETNRNLAAAPAERSDHQAQIEAFERFSRAKRQLRSDASE